MSAPRPIHEDERLAALRSFEVLDSEPEADFDALVEIASEVCGTPIALLSLVDEGRQWFKARKGLDAVETPRDQAFCAHAILGDTPLVVEDACADPRFRENPLVTGEPNIRFYAGAPLVTRDGHGLGTLCVIDRVPRALSSIDVNELRILEALGRQAVRLLELRRANAELARALSRVKLLAPLVPVCAWCRSVRDDGDYWASVDEYLERSAGVEVTHGICPGCQERLARE
jgi:GAF domain-containing protein